MPQMAPLQLSHDEMQDLGSRALDFVIHHFETNRENPVAVTLPRAQTERMLRTALPEQATPVRELVDIRSEEHTSELQSRPYLECRRPHQAPPFSPPHRLRAVGQ